MATNRSGHRPGGGFAPKQHVTVPVRTGSGSRGTNPGGVGQLGQMQGSHVTRGEESNYRGESAAQRPLVPTGPVWQRSRIECWSGRLRHRQDDLQNRFARNAGHDKSRQSASVAKRAHHRELRT